MSLALLQKRKPNPSSDQTTLELMHVPVESFETPARDGVSVTLGGLGLIQVGRDKHSQQVASTWMNGVSGQVIRNKLRRVLEVSLENLAHNKSASEIKTHWAGFGQLLEAESHYALSCLGMEFIGFLPNHRLKFRPNFWEENVVE